jgi:MYXO-CTERM domain-containing protein
MSLSITQCEEHTMSKSSTPRPFRHGVAALVGFLASLAAVCLAAPAAFARPLAPPDQSGTAASVAGQAGTPGWEIALIAIGAVLLVGLLVAVVLRRRTSVRVQRAVS